MSCFLYATLSLTVILIPVPGSCSGAAGLSSQAARLLLGHDMDGKRAMRYEDNNAMETAHDAVRLAGNLATSWQPPKPVAVFPWKDVTSLITPAALGAVGTAPWMRVLNACNMFLNDATGVDFPRGGTLAEKFRFYYGMYPDVSRKGPCELACVIASSNVLLFRSP